MEPFVSPVSMKIRHLWLRMVIVYYFIITYFKGCIHLSCCSWSELSIDTGVGVFPCFWESLKSTAIPHKKLYINKYLISFVVFKIWLVCFFDNHIWTLILHPRRFPTRNLSKQTGRYVKNKNNKSSFFMIPIPKFILKNCLRPIWYLIFINFIS